MVNMDKVKELIREALEGKECNICCTKDAEDENVVRITANKNDVEMFSATFNALHQSTIGICSKSDEAFDLYCRVSTMLDNFY